jgi:hypothetical protein
MNPAITIILELIACALFATFGFWLLAEICEAVEFMSGGWK